MSMMKVRDIDNTRNGRVNGYELRMSASTSQARWVMGFSMIFHRKRVDNSPTAHTTGASSLGGWLAVISFQLQTVTVRWVEV